MDRVGPKAFTNVSYPSTPPLDATAATQSTQATGTLMSTPKPLACTQDDGGPMMSVADSPTAQMLRQQQAAAAVQGARQTGAEGTGQGDGPSARPELTAEQAEEQRKVSKERAEIALEAGGGLLGSFGGGIGAVLGGVFGKYLSKEADNIKLPTAHENGGTAGASSTNPLDRAWDGRLAARGAPEARRHDALPLVSEGTAAQDVLHSRATKELGALPSVWRPSALRGPRALVRPGAPGRGRRLLRRLHRAAQGRHRLVLVAALGAPRSRRLVGRLALPPVRRRRPRPRAGRGGARRVVVRARSRPESPHGRRATTARIALAARVARAACACPEAGAVVVMAPQRPRMPPPSSRALFFFGPSKRRARRGPAGPATHVAHAPVRGETLPFAAIAASEPTIRSPLTPRASARALRCWRPAATRPNLGLPWPRRRRARSGGPFLRRRPGRSAGARW